MPVSHEPAFVVDVLPMVRQLADQLDPQLADREGAAISMFATPIGTLQLAMAVDDAGLSDRTLAVGADAARALGGLSGAASPARGLQSAA
jgi:hypothetical protein